MSRILMEGDGSGMTLENLLTAKREEILRLAAKRGARNVRVFGSVARGRVTPRVTLIFWWIWSPGAASWTLVDCNETSKSCWLQGWTSLHRAACGNGCEKEFSGMQCPYEG